MILRNTILTSWTLALFSRAKKCLFVGLFLYISILSQAQTSSIPAFVYHRFGDDRFPGTNIKLEQFKAHLEYLKENGYEVITLSEAIHLMDKKKKFDKTALLTIDDGYRSFYENALPLLKAYGFRATLFVNTETVGSGDFMSWEEIKAAQAAGVEIGNHSHAHPHLVNQSFSAFKSDLDQSEALFTKALVEAPKIFAYPYGEWNKSIAKELENRGYLAALAQNSGVIYKGSPRFHLPRFPMSEAYADMDGFRSKIRMSPLAVTETQETTLGYKGSQEKPSIDVLFQEANLQLNQLQCFVQGADCKKSIRVMKADEVKLNIRPDRPLNRRRTLFTVTVPDKKGNWHWYSYLYIRKEIEE